MSPPAALLLELLQHATPEDETEYRTRGELRGALERVSVFDLHTICQGFLEIADREGIR